MDEQQLLKERVNGFLKEYGDLVKKWEVDFVNFAQLMPVDRTTPQGQRYQAWEIVVNTQPMDAKQKEIASPFVAPE